MIKLVLLLFCAFLAACGIMAAGGGQSFNARQTNHTLTEYVYVAGSFLNYNGTSEPYAAGLNSDGSINSSFNPVGGGLDGTIDTMAVDTNGRIIVGGGFNNYGATSSSRIARLNSDGSLDSTFNLGSGFDGNVLFLTQDASGRILAAGWFGHYNGVAAGNITRINTTGIRDATFSLTGTGLSGQGKCIGLKSNGQIYVGGSFASYNGTTLNRIALLNSDGSLDFSFGPTGTGIDNDVNAITVDSSDRPIIGGWFTHYNGVVHGKIARLTTTGAYDATFNVANNGFDNNVDFLTQDSSGRILVGGPFGHFGASVTPGIARLNADGTIDATFNPPAFNGNVAGIAVDSAGKILVSGGFTFPYAYVARLNSDGSLDPTFVVPGTGFSASSSAIGFFYLLQ